MPNRIKLRLLTPLAIALLVLLETTIIGFYQYDKSSLDHSIREQIKGAKELFQAELIKDTRLMEALIAFLKRESCLQQQFKAADRDELLRCTLPLFKEINSNHKITHFYFHGIDQANFLRIHNPPHFGDFIDRFTMREAVETGKTASGIELGPFGTFTLRTVSPWYIDGEIAGYIELGEEIEHITPAIKKIINADLILLIEKRYLNQKNWEEGLQRMGRSGNWDQIQDFVITSHTLNFWPPELETFIRKSHHQNLTNNTIRLEKNGHKYIALGAPLLDAGDRHLGHFLVIHDITDTEAAHWALLAPMATTVLGITVLLFIFANIYIGHIQNALKNTNSQLQIKLKEHEKTEQLLLENEKKLSAEIIQRKNTAREEKVLGDILNLSLQPLDMQAYLQKVLSTLIDFLPQPDIDPRGVIFLTQHEGEGSILEMTVAHNLYPGQAQQCAQIPFGTCLCGQAAANGKLLFCNSTDEQHSINIEGMESHSLITAPITHETTVLGVVSLYLPSDFSQPEKLSDFLRRVTHVLSIGILRRYADKSLIIAMEQAEAASKAKGDFLASMSHEIRTPMNGILGMGELLKDTPLNPDQQQYVDIINRSGSHLLGVINDILDFSKAEAGHLEFEIIPFNLENSIYETSQLLSTQAKEKGLELILHYGYDCPRHLMADAGRIRQVLLNLLNNAIKFTEKGHVLIEVNCLEQTKSDATIRVSVQDTGIGIPTDKQRKLFESFTQADSSTTREFGGTGLGLAICEQIIHLMDGDIGVESTPGEGTTFWFTVTLPMSTTPQTLPTAELQNVRALVVDDNQTNLHILDKQLSSFGMQVDTTTEPHLAFDMLHAAANENHPYSLAILDYAMPGMNGEQLGCTILADAAISSVSLLLLASAAQKGDDKHFEKLGFSAYLVKPVLQETLHQTLVTVLASKQPKQGKRSLLTRDQIAATLPSRDTVLPQLSGNILLVEDNIVNQKVALSMLRKLGLNVEVANNGEEAIAYWSERKYDLILMDCQMPTIDGYEATRLIRKQEHNENQHIPIIALTANTMEGADKECLNAGMDGYIPKPFKYNDLINVLQEWLP
ncbi:response regulator [Pseudomonadota bacterium]